MSHRLQAVFASAEGEAAYTKVLRLFVEAGELSKAEDALAADLAAMDRDLAKHCLNMRRQTDVSISGWAELADAISCHEGEPVTGVAIGLMNDPDNTFDKGGAHRPELTLGIYCDATFNWSAASREELLQELSSENPGWVGSEEDIEVYLEIEGLDQLNSALIRHKNQFFFRDGNPDEAPIGYVEYVLCSWWRALRFHQAVAAEMDKLGMPGDVQVISGLVDMRPDVAAFHRGEYREVAAPTSELASLIKPLRQIRVEEAEEESAVARLKRQMAEAEAVSETRHEPEKRGFFAKFFARA